MRRQHWLKAFYFPITIAMLAGSVDADDLAPRGAWTTSNVKGKPTAPAPYKVELAFPHLRFDNPTSVLQIPGTDKLLVTQRGGKIVCFPKQANTNAVAVVGDLKALSGGDVGINSATFEPEFQTNRFLYVCMGHHGDGGHSRVSRYTLTDTADPKIVAGSERVIIKWEAGGHGGGCLHFGPDGYLYISTGDASGPAPPDLLTTGQDVSDLLGAVLRIDVTGVSADHNYAIPGDNPFVGMENTRAEIWSYGLRNPWKFGIDQQTGDIFVADNGYETWEMIHKLHAGSNCGWPIMEGRVPLRTEVALGPTPITPPIKDHPHTEANSVIGGPVYRGTRHPDLVGTFVYGDYITGTIWGLRSTETDEFEHRLLADTELHIVAFTETDQGEVYILDYDTTEQLYILRRSDEVDTSADFPRRLSDTGLFSSVESLTPAAGVVPYSVVAEPWMDGASARRWVAIPGQATIGLDDEDPPATQFPAGTVFIKHLFLRETSENRPVRLETQLMHFENGEWNPYSYLWNESETDAVLVAPHGADREIGSEAGVARTWHAGSVNECRLCHNAGAGVILGFTAKQLNRSRHADDLAHQFTSLAAQGVLSEPANLSSLRGEFVDPHDATADLDDRARSYLHTNCGLCHNRQGPATISFYAHRDYPFDELRITKRPAVGSFGIQTPQLIAPGDPYSSVILYRISKLGYGRMPYIGTRVVDSRGVELLEAWVKSLPPRQTISAPLQKDSEEWRDLAALRNGQSTESHASIDRLLKTTEGTLALVTAMHKDQLAADHVQYVRENAAKVSGDLRGLLEHFIPEAKRRKTLGANPDPGSVLQLAGDRARGKLIFLSDNARCRSCHDETDAAKSLGPTLSEIRTKYKRRSEILQHILQPSLKMDDKHASWIVVTSDGRVRSGLMVANTESELQLRLADKRLIRIRRDEIETFKKGDRSIMPDGMLSDLTAQEAADLLAYLIGTSE